MIKTLNRKLPLLISSLVLIVILAFCWLSYIQVRSASLKAGEARLANTAGQLSDMLGQSAQGFLLSAKGISTNDTVRKFLLSGGLTEKNDTREILNKLTADSSSLFAVILNKEKEIVVASVKKSVLDNIPTIDAIQSLSKSDTIRVGNLVHFGDSVYYPVASMLTYNHEIIGFTVHWRIMRASARSIGQISNLIGSDARFYVGNKDASVWSDLQTAISLPADKGLMSTSKSISNSPWQVMVSFPRRTVLAGSGKFLYVSLLIGGVLIILAFIAATLMSKYIARLIKVKVLNKELEQIVQERTSQLQSSNKELEAFSYSVSHDLRAPLRAISGFSMILKEDYSNPLGDEGKRLIERIISNSTMMGQLIDSLISFSRVGTRETFIEPIDMNKMVSNCLESLGEIKAKLKTDDLPPAMGDPQLVRQVWMNLIDNAVKYSSKKADPQIVIGCTDGMDMHIYYVMDNGVGFDMNYSNKLFGVFQRLHHANDFEGTGIGLAFAKRIIKKHGGDIWAESKPGEGATFYFSLPVVKDKMEKYEQHKGHTVG